MRKSLLVGLVMFLVGYGVTYAIFYRIGLRDGLEEAARENQEAATKFYDTFSQMAVLLDILKSNIEKLEEADDVDETEKQAALKSQIATYNQLATTYNEAMTETKWIFCDPANLLPGMPTPLRREIKLLGS
jgi:hypothetical protein